MPADWSTWPVTTVWCDAACDKAPTTEARSSQIESTLVTTTGAGECESATSKRELREFRQTDTPDEVCDPAVVYHLPHPIGFDREETAHMAQKVIRQFIDDIDGSEAERTFTFAVDGTHYEIDLSSQNIKEFHEAIAGFVESARKVKASGPGRGARKASAGTSGSGQSREQTQAVREWARQQGHRINDRGRIPASIQQAFDQAHQGLQLADAG
jgi:hypothetical protein